MTSTLLNKLPNETNIKNITNSQTTAILFVVIFIMLTGNFSLFNGILNLYPLTLPNLPFLISLALFFTSLTAIFFLIISHGRWTRWILAAFLLIASQSAYYMDRLGVIIDTVMIDNIMQTNRSEFSSLITSTLMLRTLIFGVIPAWLIIKL
jgi:lipid A ethanolaminephosphotransferase